MTHTTPSLSVRARRCLRGAAIVAASFGAVGAAVALDSGSASAATALPVNELAPEITTSARAAVVALEAYKQSGSVADEQMLAWHRAITARYTARQLGYDELEMVNAWSAAGLDHQRAVLGALTQLGVPYRYAASSENEAFDCSGLTSYAWRGAGLDLVRQSGSQISAAQPLDQSSAKPGDLVHYPGHVMLYLGVGDAIVHAPNSQSTVEVDTFHRSVRFGDPTHSG
jgi:cell wall-associated NlpC family hydrolase